MVKRKCYICGHVVKDAKDLIIIDWLKTKLTKTVAVHKYCYGTIKRKGVRK